VIGHCREVQGAIELHLTRDGYWPATWSWTPAPDAPASSPRLPMVPLAWIEGRVTDETGAPLAGASVYAESEDIWSSHGQPGAEALRAWGTPGHVRFGAGLPEEIVTKADGRYRLAQLPSSVPFTLTAIKPGFGEAKRGPLVFDGSTDGLASISC